MAPPLEPRRRELVRHVLLPAGIAAAMVVLVALVARGAVLPAAASASKLHAVSSVALLLLSTGHVLTVRRTHGAAPTVARLLFALASLALSFQMHALAVGEGKGLLGASSASPSPHTTPPLASRDASLTSDTPPVPSSPLISTPPPSPMPPTVSMLPPDTLLLPPRPQPLASTDEPALLEAHEIKIKIRRAASPAGNVVERVAEGADASAIGGAWHEGRCVIGLCGLSLVDAHIAATSVRCVLEALRAKLKQGYAGTEPDSWVPPATWRAPVAWAELRAEVEAAVPSEHVHEPHPVANLIGCSFDAAL